MTENTRIYCLKVTGVLGYKTNIKIIMGWESSDVIRFDL